MKSFAKQLAAWILLALAFLLEAFWTLLGLIAITVGTSKIYAPAGWIVGGVLLVVASELQFKPRKPSRPMSGDVDGAI